MDKTGIRVRQVHRKEVNLLFHPANNRPGLAEVCLGMARWMGQRHEDLTVTLATGANVIFYDRHTTRVTMFIAKPFEYPLRGVVLLRAPLPLVIKYLIDNGRKAIQLRSAWRLATPVARRHRKYKHLLHCPGVNPKTTPSLAMAKPFNLHRMAHASIEFHALHPSAFHPSGKRLSAAAFLIRRNQTFWPLQ